MTRLTASAASAKMATRDSGARRENEFSDEEPEDEAVCTEPDVGTRRSLESGRQRAPSPDAPPKISDTSKNDNPRKRARHASRQEERPILLG